MSRLFAHELMKLFNSVSNAKQVCLVAGCNQPAINSHTLQKNGIINLIQQNGHVIGLKNDPWRKEVHYFKPIGINEAISFQGFCAKHDYSIFQKIEKSTINYHDYETQLLFGYRAAMNEKRKKEKELSYYSAISKSTRLKILDQVGFVEKVERDNKIAKYGIKDSIYHEKHFISDIEKGTSSFCFHTIEIPISIPFCSSGAFTFETTKELDQIYRYDRSKFDDPVTQISFTLFPSERSTILILGFLKENEAKCKLYMEFFENAESKLILKEISNIFLSRIENWICSSHYYVRFLKKYEKRIISLFNYSADNVNERQDLPFNLFYPFENSTQT